MLRFFQRKHGKSRIREQDAGRHGLEPEDSTKAQGPALGSPVSPKIPPYGLKPLVSGEGDEVDIVFIHGLTGGRERTWTAPGSEFPWPQSLLPAELPAARILTFGYDADVTDLRNVVSESRVGQHAMNLLSELAQFRDSPNTSDRPLVFVCHSLGGLVCQNTLILSRQRTEPHLRKIVSSTLGIAFMGCPLRGSGLADWAERLCRALGIVKQANADIIGVLRRESEVLAIIQDGFHSLLRDRAEMGPSPIQITCFYEELEFRGIGKIVSYESAVLPGEINRSIHANHSDMTKFSSKEDPGFRAVTGELRRWINSRGQRSEGETASQRSFSPSEYQYISPFRPASNLDLDDRVPGTCLWVLENDPYLMWTRADRPAVLWLTGNAGCGKTILTNFIAQHLESQKFGIHGADYLVCSFFFVRDTKSQNNAQSVAKSLIWQIVSAKKNVVKEIKTRLSEANHGLEPSFETLWRVFEHAVSMLTCHSIYIIIDALDECEERSKIRLLSSIGFQLKLSRRSAIFKKTLKVFLSGQPKVEFGGRVFDNEVSQYHIDMEGNTSGVADDANRFIDDRVDELEALAICSPSSARKLRHVLREKGENSFLWLNVVLNHVNSSLRYHDNDLDRILAATPRTLRDSYSKYLPTIVGTEVSTLRKYLKLLVAALRPLRLVEIDALSDIENHSFASELSNEEERILKASLQRAIGPLIKFSTGTAHFIHSTVREYFLQLGEDQNHPLRATHEINEAEAHLYCAVTSASYLSSNGIPADIFNHNSSEASSFADSPISPRQNPPLEYENGHEDIGFGSMFEIQDVTFLQEESELNYNKCKAIQGRFKAYDYACWNWPHHWAKAEHVAGDHEMQQAMDLLSQRTLRHANWYRYLFSESLYKMPPPEKAGPVVLSALFNHPWTLRVLLEREPHKWSRDVLHEALYWAASRGNLETVQILLEHGVPAQMAEHKSVPLAIGAQEGSFEVCSALLGHGQADPNRLHDDSTFPIIVTATYDHAQILKLLLADARIEPDLTDISGRSAFLEACRTGSARCVKAILEDGRAEVNRRDRKGYGAIHYAVLSGDELTVRELLACVTLDCLARTNDGRNAMSLAAQSGNLQIVRRLHRAGVSAAVADMSGRNAISWAANSSKSTITNARGETVLRYLALKYPDAINVADESGWTPLAWAMDPPGYVIAVEVLVKDGRADVNLADSTSSKRSVLAWAASEGRVEIVKYLLGVEGINKNHQSSSGRTPLSEAAANGRLEVVKVMLEDEEILIDARDKSGKGPLEWARLGGHEEVAAVLGNKSRGGAL